MKNKFSVLDLGKEDDIVRANPYQIAYMVYTLLYWNLCRGNFEKLFGIETGIGFFYFFSALELAFTVAILIYNHKYEERAANRALCKGLALLAIGGVYIFYFPS